MKKTLLATTLATLTLISASSAFAADSTDLKVGGIIIPAACTPTLSNGGAIDYGFIKGALVHADNYKRLGDLFLDLTITCGYPAKIAISAINGRLGTLVSDSAENALGAAEVPYMGSSQYAFGLGMAGTQKIGGYTLWLTDPMYDGKQAAILSKNTKNGVFGNVGAGSTNFFEESFISRGNLTKQLSWGALGNFTPVEFKTLKTKITVAAYLNKASKLDLTSIIRLDGQATLELIYL